MPKDHIVIFKSKSFYLILIFFFVFFFLFFSETFLHLICRFISYRFIPFAILYTKMFQSNVHFVLWALNRKYSRRRKKKGNISTAVQHVVFKFNYIGIIYTFRFNILHNNRNANNLFLMFHFLPLMLCGCASLDAV